MPQPFLATANHDNISEVSLPRSFNYTPHCHRRDSVFDYPGLRAETSEPDYSDLRKSVRLIKECLRCLNRILTQHSSEIACGVAF